MPTLSLDNPMWMQFDTFSQKIQTAVISILARMKITAVFILPQYIFSKKICSNFYIVCMILQRDHTCNNQCNATHSQ